MKKSILLLLLLSFVNTFVYSGGNVQSRSRKNLTNSPYSRCTQKQKTNLGSFQKFIDYLRELMSLNLQYQNDQTTYSYNVVTGETAELYKDALKILKSLSFAKFVTLYTKLKEAISKQNPSEIIEALELGDNFFGAGAAFAIVIFIDIILSSSDKKLPAEQKRGLLRRLSTKLSFLSVLLASSAYGARLSDRAQVTLKDATTLSTRLAVSFAVLSFLGTTLFEYIADDEVLPVKTLKKAIKGGALIGGVFWLAYFLTNGMKQDHG